MKDVSTTGDYCISARSRIDGFTDDITGAMSYPEAYAWSPSAMQRHHYKYFRVSKFPFKRHKKQ